VKPVTFIIVLLIIQLFFLLLMSAELAGTRKELTEIRKILSDQSSKKPTDRS